jgi:hypothetical protein
MAHPVRQRLQPNPMLATNGIAILRVVLGLGVSNFFTPLVVCAVPNVSVDWIAIFPEYE